MNHEISQTLRKLKLEKNIKEDLKIFYMLMRSKIHPPLLNEKMFGIVAYTPEDALNQATQRHLVPPGWGPLPFGIISYGNCDNVKEILKEVDRTGIVQPKLEKEIILPPPLPPPTKKQFIYNIKLVCAEMSEELLEKEKDREELKRIVNKFKIKV